MRTLLVRKRPASYRGLRPACTVGVRGTVLVQAAASTSYYWLGLHACVHATGM